MTLKLRYDNFATLTRSAPLAEPADLTEPIYQAACALLHKVKPARPVRLIGVTAGPLLPIADRQFNLFEQAHTEKRRQLAAAVDAVKVRFGDGAITRARLKR